CIPAEYEAHGLMVADLVKAMVNHGQLPRALEAAGSLSGYLRQEALARIAQAAAGQRRLSTAERLLDELTDPRCISETLAALACTHVETGDRERVGELIGQAQDAARCVRLDKWHAARPWTSIAKAWMKAGDRENAEQAARASGAITSDCAYPE